MVCCNLFPNSGISLPTYPYSMGELGKFRSLMFILKELAQLFFLAKDVHPINRLVLCLEHLRSPKHRLEKEPHHPQRCKRCHD